MREFGVQHMTREQRHKITYSDQDVDLFMKKSYGIKQEDGSWIIDNNLILLKKSPIVKNGKFIVKIKEVKGNFNCSGQSLKTLEGGPEIVRGNFWCSDNPSLKSLKYAPKHVFGIYDCSYTGITSLKYLPKEIGNELNVSYTKIKTLEGGPTKANGDLYIDGCMKLKDLKGCPEAHVFYAKGMKLETLNGINKCFSLFYDSYDSYESTLDYAKTNEISQVEQNFVTEMIYAHKNYKNYFSMLFKYIIKNRSIDFSEVVKKIKWPEGFLKGNRQNIIDSKLTINKFNL